MAAILRQSNVAQTATLSLNTHGDHNVLTSFSYLDTSDPGYNDPITFPKDTKERENLLDIPGNRKTLIAQPTIVTDVSRNMSRYTLDRNGFQFVNHTTWCNRNIFLDEERIRKHYFPEVEVLLKEITGASFVHFFDYAARGPVNDILDDSTMNRPVKSVHCDQSYEGAKRVVMTRLQDRNFAADVVARRRFQIVNVWRPLKTIYKDPFAVTDARSVPESDLVALPVIAGDYHEESWASKPSAAHRWYFKFAQKPNEVLIFKCFDSVEDGNIARRVLHAAFTDPHQEYMPPRESFEVRAIVVYPQ